MTSSDKDGTSSATNVAGDNVGGGSAFVRKDGSKNSGTYAVRNYTIPLRHDNGREYTELVLYEKQNGDKRIVYGDDIYVSDD